MAERLEVAHRARGSTLVSALGLAAPLGLKDIVLMADAAASLQTPMPLLGLVLGHLL